MKNMIKTGTALLVSIMFVSLSLSSQVSRKQVKKTNPLTTQSKQALDNPPAVNSFDPFWSEDFGKSSDGRGDIGNLASGCETKSGTWTQTKLEAQGQKHNNWYISSSSAFTGPNNCSEGILKNNQLDNRTLHVGFDYRIGDHTLDLEAIYAKNESSATHCRIESPTIDCSGKSNVTLNFDYFTGGLAGQDFFSLYFFDGEVWSLISTFGPSYVSPECDSLDRATWKVSDTYQLPASADNNQSVKIGFVWKNEPGIGGNTEYYSVAIDNIRIFDNTTSVSTPTDPTSSTNKVAPQTKKSVEVETPVERKIEFTVYPNPNSGQFTIDFAGIENDHEVQIVLSDLSTGKQIYTTTFFSTSIEHNKIDVNPTEKINPGRYACSLICEGIKITKQVLIN